MKNKKNKTKITLHISYIIYISLTKSLTKHALHTITLLAFQIHLHRTYLDYFRPSKLE